MRQDNSLILPSASKYFSLPTTCAKGGEKVCSRGVEVQGKCPV